MSKARRETNSFRCSIFWKGQANSPVQRAREPSSPVAVVLAHHVGVQRARAFFRKVICLALFGRLSITTSTTCGITSPARWITTVSPILMSRPSRNCSPSPPMPLI